MTDIAFNAKNGIVANGVFTANSTLVSANGFTANLSVFSITSNVGIGTTVPGSALTVEGSASIGPTYAGTTTYTNSTLTLIPAATPTTVATAKQLTIGEYTRNSPYNLAIGYALISSAYQGIIQATAAGSAAPLSLNPNGGTVSIGTTSTSGATVSIGSNYSASTFDNSGIVFRDSSISGEDRRMVIGPIGASDSMIRFMQSGSLVFLASGGTEVARITNTGITGTLLTVSQPNITSNNSAYLGGIIASSYQLNSTLAANVATITANNSTNFAGLSLSTVQGYITANAATAYTNAVNYTSTNYAALSGFNTTAASTGTTTLPGGVILKWGTGSTTYPSGNGSGVARVLFNTSFPNACDNVTVSINAGSATASLNALIVGGLDGSNIPPGASTPTANGFSVYTTPGVNVGFFWHAIGH